LSSSAGPIAETIGLFNGCAACLGVGPDAGPICDGQGYRIPSLSERGVMMS
jgi:hypothetical protein